MDEVHPDRLCILLDGAPLCEVTESGGIAYRNKDIDEPERIAAKDKVYAVSYTHLDVYKRQPFCRVRLSTSAVSAESMQNSLCIWCSVISSALTGRNVPSPTCSVI